MISLDTKSSIRPGTKFYRIEWYDTVFKKPPFAEPKLRCVTFHRNGESEHVGEFIDDTGRGFIYAYSGLNDWYSPTPQEAYERHLRELYLALGYTENKIQEQMELCNEFRRNIRLLQDKIKECDGTTQL